MKRLSTPSSLASPSSPPVQVGVGPSYLQLVLCPLKTAKLGRSRQKNNQKDGKERLEAKPSKPITIRPGSLTPVELTPPPSATTTRATSLKSQTPVISPALAPVISPASWARMAKARLAEQVRQQFRSSCSSCPPPQPHHLHLSQFPLPATNSISPLYTFTSPSSLPSSSPTSPIQNTIEEAKDVERRPHTAPQNWDQTPLLELSFYSLPSLPHVPQC